MKSIFLKSLVFSFMALSLWSCKKDETQTVSNIGAAGTLAATATSVNLVQANGSQNAVTFNFSIATSTGYVVPVTTTLQIDIKGNNFAKVNEVVVTDKSYTPTIAQLNSMILASGAEIGKAIQIEIRLKSGAAVNDVTYSNVVSINATPYLASAWVYVPGAYQGWAPATADSLISLTSNNIYTGMIEFTPGNLEFKVTPAKNWIIAYGDAGSGNISPTVGDNFKSPDAIVKQVTVDLVKNTIVFSTPNEWSIVGDATLGGWATDTDMKVLNDGKSNIYSIKTDLKAGAFKFRYKHEWTLNLGGAIDALSEGGADLLVTTPGLYTITLDVAARKATMVKN